MTEPTTITDCDRQHSILIIDDDKKQNVNRLIGTLQAENYHIAHTKSLDDTLDYLYDHSPNLILLKNVHITNNVTEMCSRLQCIKKAKDIPIIFLTPAMHYKHIVQILDCGASDYIFKPFQSKELLARISTQIELWKKAKAKSLPIAEQKENDPISKKVIELGKSPRNLTRLALFEGIFKVSYETNQHISAVISAINFALEIATEHLQSPTTDYLFKLNNLLKENIDDIPSFIANDTRGQKVPEFIIKLGDGIIKEKTDIIKAIERIKDSIKDINAIVWNQQKYATGSRDEILYLSTIVEASCILKSYLFYEYMINLDTSKVDVSTKIIGNRTKVLHIIIALLKNASEATLSNSSTERKVSIGTKVIGKKAILSISDNGCGIPKENLTKIFTKGFTTKKGSNGFGLHSCHCLMRDMNSEMTVSSEGENKGATFSLIFDAH